MHRAKSFRFFGVTPKSSSGADVTSRDSVTDIDEEGRTASITLKTKKQKSQEIERHKHAEEHLRELFLKMPKDLDCQEMRDAIADGVKEHVDDAFLERCRTNLSQAEKLAERKREQERLKRMQERCEEVTSQLDSLLQFELLAVDLSSLSAALQVSAELDEETGPHKVEEELSQRARQFLTDAENAHTERRRVALAALQTASSCLLTVEPEGLRKACEDAKVASVEKAVLSAAYDLLKVAEMRENKGHKLTQLASADAAALKVDELRKAWTAALQAGTPAATLSAGLAKLRAAEETQAERSVSSARLAGLLEAPAQYLDVDAVREAKALAEEADAAGAILSKADEKLSAAAAAQLLKDAATASLLALSAPRAPEKSDITLLTQLLPRAPAAGVSEDVVAMGQVSLKEAEDAASSHVDDKRLAHIARLHAANARTAESAPARKARLEKRTGEAEAAVEKAHDAAEAKRASMAQVLKESEAALEKVVTQDATVRALSGDEQARAWAADEALRKALVEADGRAVTAHAELEVALLIERDAVWQVGKAKRETGVYAQIAQVIRDAGEIQVATEAALSQVALREKASAMASAAKQRKKEGRKEGGGGGGCCGGGKKPPAVDEPVAADAEAVPLLPLPLLIDEIAWSPLKLPSGSSHQIELLLAFALGGFYSHGPICSAVATAMCAADPTYHTCSSFVLGLSNAYTAGSVTLTAGSGMALPPKSGGSMAKRISHMMTPRDSKRDSSRDSGSMSRSESIKQRSGSSFLRGRVSRNAPAAAGPDKGAWPGREVQCEISAEQFKTMLEIWLARMARGSQAKGQGSGAKKMAASAPAAAGGSKADDGGASSVGRLSATIGELMRPPHSDRLEAVQLSFADMLTPLLQRHYEVTEGRQDEGDEGDEAAMEAAAALADVHACIEMILGASRKDPAAFKKLLPAWTDPKPGTSPAAALAGMARAFITRIVDDAPGYEQRKALAPAERAADMAHERVVLALVELFVTKPDSLTGFQQLVPAIFDVHLALDTPLRNEMCDMLAAGGGMDSNLAARMRTDDDLVRQPFFWSAPGMKLFGNAPELSDPEKLKQLLADALSQQAIIASAFLDETIKRASAEPEQASALPQLVATTLSCLLDHVKHEGGADKVRRGVLLALDTILFASATFSGALFAAVAPAALEAWSANDQSAGVLDFYVDTHLKPRLDKGSGKTRVASEKDEAIVQTLCSLFIAQPSTLTGFLRLTPDIFDDILALGSEARKRVNNVLMTGSFEPRLAPLIAESDDFVKSSFFWAADGAMSLCLKERVASNYSKMNAATLTGKDGTELHLYSRLLALLLRLSSLRGGEIADIAFRTQEVLDQFERNPEQQKFVLTIIEKLDERSVAEPAAFDDIALTVLSDVAANGVQTITSVQGDGLALCEQAMTTLLQSYVSERPPSEWKDLFKEATNIAFMVKYMFRESLEIAKSKFQEALGKKNANFSGEAHTIMSDLVKETLMAYGEVGIYDPERLAEIDFLNHPDQLVDLVSQSKNRRSRMHKPDMMLLTDVTTKWMQLMVDKKYPPLTPHHTQAFTVLLMCKFFQSQILDPPKKQKTRFKAFVAQMSTGEGKSIVIAMLAIFMVKLFNVRVHVLENNAGLLQRDYLQNKPFYDKFDIKCSANLDEEGGQIYYCLKDAINRRFLRKLVEGKLDEELGQTVLIVDEVDDLIVNERPNSHYVKKDAERSPALQACYETLKKGVVVKPDSAEDEVWEYAQAVVKFCDTKTQDKHYRVVQTKGGGSAVMMLDADGNLPKVALTSPWLSYLNYSLCSVKPFSETRHATVCTPYIFNKYKGIFGLTGSVGGKAELKYLATTYKAIKFDVPRFLDTCEGDARKVVRNHGVEVVADEAAQIERVAQIAGEHFKKVPVLIICSSLQHLQRMYKALSEGDGKHGVPPTEVQRFAQFSTDGRSLAREWQTVIDDATKRFGNAHESRCRVTVTDKFGGRGHDFQVIDKEANANGGMLVIATSIPNEREWIQWKGRTARQDRPGQFYVVLDKKSKPFDDPKHKKLEEKLRKLAPSGGGNAAEENAKVDTLLELADEGIGERLKAFEVEQAQGEKLNELTEKYYKKFPRGFDDPWPNEQYSQTDGTLRKILTSFTEIKPKEMVQLFKQELDIDVDPH